MAWEVKKLGDICKIVKDKPPSFTGTKKYYTTRAINNSRNYSPVLVTYSNRPGRANIFPKINDVGFALMKETNKVFLVDEDLSDSIFSTGFAILRPNTQILSKYLFIFIQSDLFQQIKDGLSGSGIMGGIKKTDIPKIKIPVPSLEEQKQIVAKLDQCFEAIDKAKTNATKNLENAKELFQSKLNDSFSQKGEEWVEKKLGDVCENIFAGGDKPENISKFKTSELCIPVFSNGEKNKGLYGYTDTARVKKPSITISGRGTIGYSEIRKEPFLPIVRLITLIPNSEIININLLHYGIQTIEFINSGSSIPQLTVPMVKGYSIPIPPLAEQKQIVKLLDNLKEQTQTLESKYQQELNSLEELKKSILKKTFNGELTEVLA